MLFTDEVRICADPGSGRIRVWRTVGARYQEENFVERDRWGGVNIMVWGAISHNVRLGPVFFNLQDGNPGVGVNANRYVNQIITPHILPFFQTHQNWLFQQDNATAHSGCPQTE